MASRPKSREARRKTNTNHLRLTRELCHARLNEAFGALQRGELAQANQLTLSLIQQSPENADAWHLMGLIAMQCSSFDAALQSLNRAIDLDPHNATSRTNRGTLLAKMGQHDRAVNDHTLAIRLQPGLPEAHNNLGTSLRHLNNLSQATEAFREAIRLRPQYVEAICNLGTTLTQSKNPVEGEQWLREAIRLSPGHLASHINLANLLQEQEREDEAFLMLHQAVRVHSRSAEVFHNMGHLLLAKGATSDAITCFRAATELNSNYASDYLFALSHDAATPPREVFEAHVAWGQSARTSSRRQNHANPKQSERRLRIGYVSPDFRRHVVAAYIEPVLRAHDPASFEIHGFVEVPRPDETTARLRSLCHKYHSTVGLSDADVADLIEREQIDILVDLAGHTAHSRIRVFAHKPSPIQVTWLGYGNTTGLSEVDYRITNEYQNPRDEPSFHSERLVYLPRESAYYGWPVAAPDVGPLPADRNGFVTFGSLHRPNKLTAETLEVWAGILHAVPSSRLWIFWPSFHGNRRAELVNRFASLGIDEQRLEIRWEPIDGNYLSEYNQIDIALDVFHWTGSTTAREAMWMGAIQLAHRGAHRSARGSAAVVHYAGLNSCIADSPSTYVALAREFASDWGRLATLRSSMRQQLVESFGTAETFTRQLEALYRGIWRDWCQSPDNSESPNV
jgi:protein O-GlcNAc transferase